jgi:transposase InsO family protein
MQTCRDITSIPTWAGWLYLATVIDCFNRECDGGPRTTLVSDALGMAARNHRLAAGCIFHSDRGHPIHLGRIRCDACFGLSRANFGLSSFIIGGVDCLLDWILDHMM